MRFYFPDSQDQIDPHFDFVAEAHPPLRRRQRDDRYAHEVFREAPYDGILISKSSVDGLGGAARYNRGHRRRLFREGMRKFFRLDVATGPRIATIGDCGAFSYVEKIAPPYRVDEVIDFYELTGVDAGLSVDHIVRSFSASGETPPPSELDRHAITLALAEEFIARHRRRGCGFEPVGVAQGYDPASYAEAVARLEAMGYGRIAVGGMASLKSTQITKVLEAISRRRAPETRLHLLGISRLEELDLEAHGVESTDSTTPFRQAFMDGSNNLYAPGTAFTAIRVPQSDGNRRMRALIAAGRLEQGLVRRLEGDALAALRAFDDGAVALEETLDAVCAYASLLDPRDRREAYRRTLVAAPWRTCRCEICVDVGIEVALFRGAERNKRRGFHNLYVHSRCRPSSAGAGTDGTRRQQLLA